MDDNLKWYLTGVKELLISKYNLDKNLAAEIISRSYILPVIALFPEECLHDDIEGVVDNIYQDYTEGRL